jgi:hypothetical protein
MSADVTIKFGSAVPDDVQSEVMMAMERNLKDKGVTDARVLKERMADDLVSRRKLTPEQRMKL